MIRIKDFCKRKGISQDELAKELGVSNNTVSLWANGKRDPARHYEEKLLKMGMTVEELFGYPYPSSVRDINPKSEMLDFMIDALEQVRRNIGNINHQGEDK